MSRVRNASPDFEEDFEEDFEPHHATPTAISMEGMFAAAIETLEQNVRLGDLRSVFVAYDYAGECQFAGAYNLERLDDETVDAFINCVRPRTDIWFSVQYAPFLLDDGILLRGKNLLGAIITAGHICDGTEGIHGLIGLVRKDTFAPLWGPVKFLPGSGMNIFATYNECPM